ncbi:GAF domain-containing protein [Tenacibaculum halocynthiae]|uniref:GAF domain-containing protein n=1 Tax=Tenacibaculum halocynthiae TaxID=1254437 RepID=UPI003D65DF7E
MEIKSITDIQNIELPLQLNISFKRVFEIFQKYADIASKHHPFHESAKVMIREIEKAPELINGFSDFSLLKKHENTINHLLDALFPEILSNNEIKVATIPFSFTTFKYTERFKNILENAGEDYELKVRNFEDDVMYIYACTLILGTVYNYPVDLKRPFFFDIPDKKLGVTKHYRVAFNGDFMDISPSKNAPEITKEDIKLLLDNFNNIDIWREKFPPNSYIFKGFGIMNLFDVTADETLSAIRTNLLQKDDGSIVEKLQKNLSEFYTIKDLKVGFSVYDVSNIEVEPPRVKISESILIENGTIITCNDFFCDHIISKIFNKNEEVVLSDIEQYGINSGENVFYQKLKEKNIGSIILIPIKTSTNRDLVLLEIASPRPYELNSVNKQKLKDIIPVFKAAAERNSEEFLNTLEATIQEHYTSIHPSVKWRFYEAAEKYQNALFSKQEEAKIEQIVFENVYPLYGQIDVKGSSIARNTAIKDDLTTQLTLAINVLNEACKAENLPIYNELTFRVKEYLHEVKKGLKAGDEIGILDFLKKDIYPVFNHVKEINLELTELVKTYTNSLDANLHVVYDKRKAYEQSVTKLNDKLAKFIDTKQEEAQEMFPHYFERYKTDGVEYNMYIGQSLTRQKKFDELYLYNLRLWQLQTMCEMENLANTTRKTLTHDLEVASLILVHSNSLAIKFRMDEKQFDVDGAYNIRYEIIKKRIDKAHIKNTNDRLTIPGKIAIVYSQDKDAREYLKYIKYLQSKNQLGSIEKLELEDLQGVSGLKALRVEVIYQNDFTSDKTITIDQLLHDFKQ